MPKTREQRPYRTTDPNRPVCRVCGLRVEFIQGIRFVGHLQTVAGRQAESSHSAIMAPAI